MAKRPALAVLVLHLAVFLIPSGRAASRTSIEYELLSLVNGGRAGSLVMHSGLVGAARGHSREMGASGALSHSGARSRVAGAAPDPAESNGAPDDGFTGTWCENIAYITGGPASDVASRIYDGWRSSATHLHCMTDPDVTAAGMGVYFDGETWWATMEAFGDKTPPGPRRPAEETFAPATKVRTDQGDDADTPAVVATDQPDETAPMTTEPPEAIAARADSAPASDKTPMGTPEVAAGIGIIVVCLLSYRYFNRIYTSR